MLRFIVVAAALLCVPLPALSAGNGWFPDSSWTDRAPRTFKTGRLKCAANVNAALAERGIKGSGSDIALSFLGWGRASGPVVGAVAVRHRKGKGKGHAAIVSRVESGGTVCIHNPGRRGWQERCGQRFPYYRVP